MADPPAPSDASDLDLMRAVSGRDDEAALAGLIARYREKLANYFRRSGVFTDDEDLVQEVFVRLWKARARWQPTARFNTWLYTLARNALIDRARRAVRWRRVREEAEALAAPHAEPPPVAASDTDAALASLKSDLREAVVLVVCQGLKYREAAEVLAVPEGTVKSRVHEALQRLRTWYARHA